MLNKVGQISVILIIFIAVLLAAFAVIVNIGKMSQNKTSGIVAVDTSAALMASLIASHAESQYQGIINAGGSDDHGDLTRRETSSIWTLIASLIIAIVGLVLVILGCFTEGTTAVIGAWVISIAAVVLAAAAIVIQLAVIAPAMQGMWNRMFSNLTIQEQFREQGIQSLFSYSAQDPVMIPDTGDFDMDGYFNGDGTPEGEADKVGRFSFLYTRRAEYLAKQAASRTGYVKDFLKALAQLVYDQQTPNPPPLTPWKIFSWEPAWDITPDGFGMHDKEIGGCPLFGYFKNECETTWCSVQNTTLPELCPSNGTPWKFIYDWSWENPINTFLSFREQVGRDDENASIRFLPPSSNPPAASAVAQTLSTPEMISEDSTGLYRLLWALDKVDLAGLNTLAPGNHEPCTWCGVGAAAGQNFNSCPADFSGFTLPRPNECNANNPLYQSSPNGLRDCWCLKPTVDPIVTTPTQVPEDTCYNEMLNTGFLSFLWKKGMNLYCSEDLPYGACAGKNCPGNCVNQNGNSACCTDPALCSSTCDPVWTCGKDPQGNPVDNKSFWREDLVDYLRYGSESIDSFIQQAEELFWKTPQSLVGQSLMASWIKIAPNLEDAGILQKWIAALAAIKQELTALMNGTFSPAGSFVCSGSNAAAINTCFNDTLTAIQNCMNIDYCSNNTSVCSALATQLGIYFEEPPSTSGSYAGQATGCALPGNVIIEEEEENNTERGAAATLGSDYVFQYELQNWKAKIQHRKNYLANLYSQAQAAIGAADLAQQKIQGFLDDPRVALMRTLSQNPGSMLSNDSGVVVYAWRDEAKLGQPATSGKWHAVRAEAFLPTLCDNKCGRTHCDSP
ncbi:MAG: hypothetical protein WCX16_05935, partial [Candidatus Omnitrophota bacterium]